MTINASARKEAGRPLSASPLRPRKFHQVPATDRDARLDLVLTEREIIDFRERY